MDIAEALQIVIDLAKEHVAAKSVSTDPDNRITQAINMVEDLAVNEFGDD